MTLLAVRTPDWRPLRSVLSEAATADWLWLHRLTAPDGADVHGYKHVRTLHQIHLDADGHVYRVGADAMPRRLPPCGGATLLLSLAATSAGEAASIAPAIALPDVARQPVAAGDHLVLAEVAVALAGDLVALAAAR